MIMCISPKWRYARFCYTAGYQCVRYKRPQVNGQRLKHFNKITGAKAENL